MLPGDGITAISSGIGIMKTANRWKQSIGIQLGSCRSKGDEQLEQQGQGRQPHAEGRGKPLALGLIR